MTQPRSEIISLLSNMCLDTISTAPIENLTPAEVMSTCFTLCRRVITVMVDQTSGAELAHNKSEIINAVAGLYQMVLPDKSQIQ